MKYRGEWSDGNFNGNGTFYFTDGSRYEGGFKDGQMEGSGKFFDKYGDLGYQGMFQKDTKIDTLNNYSEPIITVAILSTFLLTRLLP